MFQIETESGKIRPADFGLLLILYLLGAIVCAPSLAGWISVVFARVTQ